MFGTFDGLSGWWGGGRDRRRGREGLGGRSGEGRRGGERTAAVLMLLLLSLRAAERRGVVRAARVREADEGILSPAHEGVCKGVSKGMCKGVCESPSTPPSDSGVQVKGSLKATP